MSGKTIDVCVERLIPAAPGAVAAVMFEPDRDPGWMKAVVTIERIDPAFGLGARVRRRARFLGKDIAWTTTVRAYDPPHRLVLDIADGPFSGEIVYEIRPDPAGSRVSIRNTGAPGQFAWMPVVFTRAAMRTSLSKDLARLERLVTAPGDAD
jgi:uncharacterized protein YndB with AHSA1/START domain